MVLECLNSMLINKYNNYLFYCHNFGKFDFIFIFNIMLKYNEFIGHDYYELKPILSNGKLLKLDIKINKNYGILETNPVYIKISFIDSYNILSNSLDNLTRDFKVNYLKGKFPYSFVNENNLNYNGLIPDFSYFNNIKLLDYQEYCESYNNTGPLQGTLGWNLKEESIKYCLQDCISLHQVLINFNQYIFDLYKSIYI